MLAGTRCCPAVAIIRISLLSRGTELLSSACSPFVYLFCVCVKLSVPILCPFFVELSCKNSFYILDQSFVRSLFYRYFLPDCGLPVHFLSGGFSDQNSLIVIFFLWLLLSVP